MRTLLRHSKTGQYFRSLDSWTVERDDAHDFGLVARAIKFAKKIKLPNLELIIDFDNPAQIDHTPLNSFLRRMLRTRHG